MSRIRPGEKGDRRPVRVGDPDGRYPSSRSSSGSRDVDPESDQSVALGVQILDPERQADGVTSAGEDRALQGDPAAAPFEQGELPRLRR